MIRSILIGIVAGARSMTPLAVVTDAARRGTLPDQTGLLRHLGNPIVSGGALMLAAGELAGDKMKSAPDRIIAPGMAARLASAGIAGYALARDKERPAAALLAAATAVGAAYLTFNARVRAMTRYGQTRTGIVEDAIAVGSALAIAHAASPARANT